MECVINDVSIHYVDHGEGRPVLALHGTGVDHREVMACLEPVFEAVGGCRRIYPDLPGMGRTAAPETVGSADDVLQLLMAFIDEVIGDQPFLLVGHSAGGYYAQAIASRRAGQVLGLALLCPLLAELPDIPEPDAAQRSGHLGSPEFREYFVVQTSQTLERYERYVAPAAQLADQSALARIGEHWELTRRASDQTASDRPTLLVTGRQDSTVGYAGAWQMLEHYPHATFAVVDRAGHAPAARAARTAPEPDHRVAGPVDRIAREPRVRVATTSADRALNRYAPTRVSIDVRVIHPREEQGMKSEKEQGTSRRKRYVVAAGAVVSGISLASGGAAVAAGVGNGPDAQASAKGDLAQVAVVRTQAKPPKADPTQKALNAYFHAGYDYDDAVRLGKLWHESPFKAKIQAGDKLLAGGKLPIKHHAPGHGATEVQTRELNAFFNAGYTYQDAVRLARLWHTADAYHAKLRAGGKLLHGGTLPFPPR